MPKLHKNISIDEELNKKAEERCINVSEVTDKALRDIFERTSMKEKVNTKHYCQFCGREDRLATRDDLTGLTWLWPDEKWICESCLNAKSAALAVTASIHQ